MDKEKMSEAVRLDEQIRQIEVFFKNSLGDIFKEWLKYPKQEPMLSILETLKTTLEQLKQQFKELK